MSTSTLSRGATAETQPQGTTILDELMPRWDATRVESRVVRAPMGVVFDEALHLDFLDVPRRHFAVRALFAVRSAAERVVNALLFRKAKPAATPLTMRLTDLPQSGEWVRLGNSRPFEFAFGAIGRFWAGETNWLESDAEVFRSFDLPGYARIACHFHLSPQADGVTLLKYEARTSATDHASRKAFLRYWWLVSFFVGIVMRATLTQIRKSAEQPRRSL
jgi:hypothetical protein